MKKEYNVEQSPFYSDKEELRATLSELNASNGEDVVLARKRYFKRDEYVKFIINPEFDILTFHKLPRMAVTVLHYILYHCLEYNSPTFRFKAKDFAQIVDKDISVIHKAVNSLINVSYMAKTKSKEVYWINHNAFYKGNFMIDKYLKTK